MSKADSDSETFDIVLTLAAAAHLECNAYNMRSVVNHDDGTSTIEHGMRVTFFDVSPLDLCALWAAVSVTLGLTCAWIDSADYTGCILESPYWKSV